MSQIEQKIRQHDAKSLKRWREEREEEARNGLTFEQALSKAVFSDKSRRLIRADGGLTRLGRELMDDADFPHLQQNMRSAGLDPDQVRQWLQTAQATAHQTHTADHTLSHGAEAANTPPQQGEERT